MGWVALDICLGLMLLALLFSASYWLHRRKLSRIERELSGADPLGGPDRRTLDDLPGPARKLLQHMIAPDAPAVRAVEFRLDGEIKPGENAAWLPIRSTEMLRIPGGYTWRAATAWPMKLAGGDHYFQNDGGVNFWLFGILHIVRGKGADVMRSARGRTGCEAMWFPPALLAAEWLPGDVPSCRLEVDGEDYTLAFRITDDGRITSVCGERWSNETPDRTWQKIKFGADFSGEVTAQGYTLPSDFVAGWNYGTDAWEPGKFFRASLSEVQFIE